MTNHVRVLKRDHVLQNLSISDGDCSCSGSYIFYDGDLGLDSGDDENGAGDGEGPNVVDGDSDDGDDALVVGHGVRGRGRGRGHRGGRCGERGQGSGGGGRGGGMKEEFDFVRVVEKEAKWLGKGLVVDAHMVACEDADKDAGEETGLCTVTEMAVAGQAQSSSL